MQKTEAIEALREAIDLRIKLTSKLAMIDAATVDEAVQLRRDLTNSLAKIYDIFNGSEALTFVNAKFSVLIDQVEYLATVPRDQAHVDQQLIDSLAKQWANAQ